MAEIRERSAKITSKGQITIPIEIRRALGVGEGDSVVFRSAGGAVTLIPMKKRTLSDLLAGFDPDRHRHEEQERPWDDAPKGRETI